MPTNDEYEAEIKKHRWPELGQLWERIKARDTPWWPDGKAFEYLVLRMFDLDDARVRWPYGVSLLRDEEEVEQIDGSVRVGSLYCLVESKDKKGKIDIAPIAKLRNQLLRRPAGTVGFVFSSSAFTEPALALAHFALPQAILLWSGDEVERALAEEKICDYAELKFRICVDQGMPDYNITDPPKRTPL
jgi:hypothetical protein